MEKCKNLLTNHSGKIKYLFLLGAMIAGLNTLSRADYNFVLYLYMFYVWGFMGNAMEIQRQDKLGTFFIIFYSLFIDVFWCLFWGGKWDTIPTIAHELTLFLSWVGVIVKVIIMLVIGLLEWDTIKSSLMGFLKAKDIKSQGFTDFHDEY